MSDIKYSGESSLTKLLSLLKGVFDTKLNLPKTTEGAVDYGAVDQIAVSDGAGGITWKSMTNVAEEGM